MDDETGPSWEIRRAALAAAVNLESELHMALTVQNDDVSDMDSRSAAEAATMTARYQAVTAATVDRVLQHAEIFERYLRAGTAGDDLDALLAGPGEAAQPHK
jgi:hypothetical protein